MKMFHIGVFTCLVALGFLSYSNVAIAQDYRNCAWPIELSPEGYGNATGPESLARYFLIPFDTQYESMTIKGAYPNVRYFSYVAYEGARPTAIVDDDLYDAEITPDPGSVNPFVRPQKRTTHPSKNGVKGTYTVVVSRTESSSGNTIRVPEDRFVWVMLRMYIPSADPSLSGQSLTGGVPLPTIMLTTKNGGGSQELSQCSQVNDLQDMTTLLQDLFGDIDALVGAEGTPSTDRLWFASVESPPMRLFPNPHNKYIAMLPGDNYQPGRIIVIRGKAPGTPYTYDGSPIWDPARGFRAVDMRYWALCNVNLALPITNVDCTADLITSLQGGDYTIVISDDLLRPDWLRPNINWLRWGDQHYPKLMFFRNMLPDPDFPFSIQKAIEVSGCTFEFNLPNIPKIEDTIAAGQCSSQVMGDYYPVAVWCDKSTFVRGGWQACIKGQ